MRWGILSPAGKRKLDYLGVGAVNAGLHIEPLVKKV